MVEEVAFCGLGAMGSAMASNLQEILSSQSRKLHVWNRSKGKAEPLEQKGAVYLQSVEEVAQRCALVFVMLGDDAALQAVFAAYISAPQRPEGAVFIDHSTVAPSLTAKQAEQARAKGVTYLSCPVFGRPDAAAAKGLLVIAAGAATAKAQVKPYLEAMGRGVLDVGDQPSQGSTIKLVGNFYISTLTEMFAEGMALGEKNGCSRESLVALAHDLLPGRIAPGYATRCAKGDFVRTPQNQGFALSGGQKDVGHILQLGRESGVKMPIAEITMGHFQEVSRLEGGLDLDWGAVAMVVREAAGLPQQQS